MQQTVLGRSEVTVPTVALGTWSHGGPSLSEGQPVGWAGQEDSDSRQVLILTWEAGMVHWDTADVYGQGRSERVIGSIWDTVPREEIFLATKVGWARGPYEHYYHPEHMRRQLEKSLRNLNCEVIDLYYLHHCNFGPQGEYFDDAIEVLRRAREAGKIRFSGLSDWSSEKIMAYIESADPDVVQPYRNVVDDSYASSGLKEWVESHNLGVCFFSPLKHGLLTGKYSQPASFPKGDFRANIKDFQDPATISRLQANRALLEERFRDHPQPVLHGVVDALLSDTPTGCVLLGQRNETQVQAAATLGTPLTAEDARWVLSLYGGTDTA